MTAREKFSKWLTEVLTRLRRWQVARAIKWEDRYIHQYEKQIADALRGIEESKRRRALASRTLNTKPTKP